MGTLYRNGIPYVGSGGAGGVEVTQAEYDALPTSEKMNGSIYFITDGSVSYPTASQMRYDNTESGIPSTSVQGAIDELKIEIGDTDISTIGDGTVTGAVDALNTGLTNYGLQTLNSLIKYHKIGHVVSVYVYGAMSSVSSSWKTIGTLPAGYRPTNNAYVAGFTVEKTHVAIAILESGDVMVRLSNGESAKDVTSGGLFTYVVN